MDIALICLAIAVIGLFLSRKKLAEQKPGPVLLSLQCPITISDVRVHGDGCVGSELYGSGGGVFDFCLDRRPESPTLDRLFINALHPDSPGAERVARGAPLR